MNKILAFLILSILISLTNSNEKGSKNSETTQQNNEKDKINEEIDEEEFFDDDDEEEEIEDSSGVYISERMYYHKLKKIIHDKRLHPNNRISKQKLHAIFDLIYKEDLISEEDKIVDPKTNLTVEQTANKYWNIIFNEITKGIEPKEKIKVKDIEEWIHPDRVQQAYAIILEELDENQDL